MNNKKPSVAEKEMPDTFCIRGVKENRLTSGVPSESAEGMIKDDEQKFLDKMKHRKEGMEIVIAEAKKIIDEWWKKWDISPYYGSMMNDAKNELKQRISEISEARR